MSHRVEVRRRPRAKRGEWGACVVRTAYLRLRTSRSSLPGFCSDQPIGRLGSKALHKPSCAVEAGLKWQLKVRQMIANLREAQRHNMRVRGSQSALRAA